MSYRAFKRLFGETSLERKCRLMLGAVTLVLITASFWFYAYKTDTMAYDAITNSGRLLVPLILAKAHVGQDLLKQAIDQFQEQSEQGRQKDALAKYSYAILKPNAKKPENKPDPGEAGLMDLFSQNTGKLDESRQPAGGDFFVYYAAVRATASCLKCHPRSDEERAELGDLKEGGLMAVVRVKLSNAAIQDHVHIHRAYLIAIGGGASFVIMAFSYLIVRYVIVKPVKHLKEVSDAISAGKLNVRSEIQTGDEFEDLSFAFNRMLRNLMATQDELKELNTDLDRKVDELARANMALYESNRLKSDFLATMSHELRTPLNSILGFSDLMLNSQQIADRLKRWAGNIQSSGKQLLALINDILDLARVEAGKMEVRPEEFALTDVTDGLMTMFRPLAERKNIDLREHIDSALPRLRQDAGKIRQILSNLLSNAIKFTPEGGRVLLRAESAGSEVRLVVSDTGVGIAPEDREVIFDKFRQAANPMTREHEGTGLGLSIVRELAKLLGGDVSLESELGRGSTFTVHLPQQLIDAPRVHYLPPHFPDGPDPTPRAVAG
jgi:two-component system sensor histidine kinase BarA